MADRAFIDKRRTDTQSAFQAFKDRRLFWDGLVQRREKPIMDPKITNVGYYQTPSLRVEENNVVDILTMNPTRLDAHVMSEGKHAEDAVRDAVLWAARTLALMNNGRWVDMAIAAGQARHGVKVMRLRHKAITEPDTADDGESTMDARDEAMKARGNVFAIDDAETLASSWLERNRHINQFVYEADIPYADAYDEFKRQPEDKGSGKYQRPALDPQEKLIWVGDDQPIDQGLWLKKLKHVVVEWLDDTQECPICSDEHLLYSGAEYLCGPNEKPGEDNEIRTYTLPWKYQGSFRVIGGRVNWLDKDPDERYQPLLYELLVEATIINWCQSMLLTMANRDSADERVYGSLSKTTPEQMGMLPEGFWDTMSVDLPEPGSGKVPVYPFELLQWPTKMAESLTLELDRATQRFEAAKTNRFLTGQAYKETAEGTGSMGLQQAQAAALPYDRPLGEDDLFWWEILQDIFHAIKLWDHDKEPGTEQKYYVTTTGDEALAKGKSEPGQAVFMSASKLAYDFDLVVKTENKTKAEETNEVMLANFLYMGGHITYAQFLERIGITDTEHQMGLLHKERLLRRNEPKLERVEDYAFDIMESELMGVPVEILNGSAGMQPPMQTPVSGPGTGAASQQPPGGDLNGQKLNEPTIKLPPMNRPSGGNSPMGAMA